MIQGECLGLSREDLRLGDSGTAIEGRELYVLPEDGPSRVFHYQLDT